MEVQVREEIDEELDNITQYIMKDRPNTALKIFTEITNKIYSLSNNYKLYRFIGDNIRLMPIHNGKFRVLYKVDIINNIVDIRAIQHHSQNITPYLN